MTDLQRRGFRVSARPRSPNGFEESAKPCRTESRPISRFAIWPVLATLGTLACSSPAPAPEVIDLFNGEDLTGWTVYGTELWYVEDGTLVCESGPDAQYGYLATNEHYDDFDLTVDFKQEADGNSGLFFRSTVEGTTVSGWQAEVAPPGFHTGGIYESYGRGWLIQPDSGADQSLRMGDWNQLRVRS